ncbi:MAG: hypothetical protein U0166_01400 [Acidobacteriota bacterium]
MPRKIGPALYVSWATIAIGLSLAAGGLSRENVTRLLVVAFLLAQVACRGWLVKALPALSPSSRFVVTGTLLACVVEGFHMISVPVFGTLRIDRATPFAEGLRRYALDLAFTVPAYLVIFWVIWSFVRRFRYGTWPYVFGLGLAQALGDGGLFFFAAAPAMLALVPYPMTNYHAINVIPFLAIRDGLARAPARASGSSSPR